MRRLVVVLLTLFLGLGAVALTAPAARAQENRPTGTQPSPGTKIGQPERDYPWSYNHVARYFAVFVLIILPLALLVGFIVRWIGLGRRTT